MGALQRGQAFVRFSIYLAEATSDAGVAPAAARLAAISVQGTFRCASVNSASQLVQVTPPQSEQMT